MDTTTPWTTFVYACLKTSPPKTRSGASSPGWPQTGTSSHKRPFTSCSATISSTHDACSEITTRPMTMTPAFEASFTPGHSGEFECRDSVKSAAKVRCALLQPIQHRHWCIRPTPSRHPVPSSTCAFANRAPPSFRSQPGCASPGSTSPFAPGLGLAPTPSWTPSPTSTSRLCPNYDCTSRSAWSKSFPPLTSGRSSTSTSPPLASPTSAPHNDSGTDLEPDFGMMDNATVDSRVRQDDYQQPTGSGRIGGGIAPLTGSREFDVVYMWPNSQYGVNFNALL